MTRRGSDGSDPRTADADDAVYVSRSSPAGTAPTEGAAAQTEMVPAYAGADGVPQVLVVDEPEDPSWWGDAGPASTPAPPTVVREPSGVGGVPTPGTEEPWLDGPPSAAPDVFERRRDRPSFAGLSARAPALESAGRSDRREAAAGSGKVTVSELARRAELERAQSLDRPSSPAGPSAPHVPAAKPRRRYPMMRALLADPSAIPDGSDPHPSPRAPPVPGTYFPTAPAPEARIDVDGLLSTMAEGLLVGGSRSATQVVVTLRDEFFKGTELHVSVTAGRVSAELVPPDHETYRTLADEIERLGERLRARGLGVSTLSVRIP